MGPVRILLNRGLLVSRYQQTRLNFLQHEEMHSKDDVLEPNMLELPNIFGFTVK